MPSSESASRMWDPGPRQTTIQAAIENVPARPTTTPTKAAADAQNSGSRSSFAGGTSMVGWSVAKVASIADSLLKPRVEATPRALCTRVRGIVILRTSRSRSSRKFTLKADPPLDHRFGRLSCSYRICVAVHYLLPPGCGLLHPFSERFTLSEK